MVSNPMSSFATVQRPILAQIVNLRPRLDRWIIWILHGRLYWASLMSLPWIASAIYVARHRMNGDVAWYLYAAQRLREGARLYRDIDDMNMPLTYYIGTPFVALGGLLKISPSVPLYCAVWLFLAVALLGLYRVLRTLGSMNRLMAQLFVLMVAAVVLGTHCYDFGQRDQYVGIGFLVLLQQLYARIHGRPVARHVMLALTGVVIAIKPFFLLPWLLMLLWTARRISVKAVVRSPEFWVVAGISACLGIATLLFTDFVVMAAVATQYYKAYDASIWSIVSNLRWVFVIVLVAIVWRPSEKLLDLVRLSALAAAGFAIEVIAQHKSYSYHHLPAEFWAYITGAVLFIDLLQRASVFRRICTLSPNKVVLAVSLAGGILPFARAMAAREQPSKVMNFVRQHATGKLILPLSTNLWTAFPVILEANARNALPSPELWTVPGLYRDQIVGADAPRAPHYHSRSEMNEQERRMFDCVVQAMVEKRPAILLVQPASGGQGLGHLTFDFLKYFSTDERFRAALADYATGPSDAGHEVYWRRQ